MERCISQTIISHSIQKDLPLKQSCFAALFIQHKRVLESEPDKAEENIRDWETKLMEDELKENRHSHVPQNVTLPILSRSMFSESIVYKKPVKSLHFTCITIGTRGDVQPYIALCKGLMKDGHRCRIATHDEFKDWIEEHDIEFRTVGGDPGELMRICVENNFFSVNFVREGLRLFKGWIDELLDKTWKAVQGTDIIIESPSAMVGIHMAEALCVPYFRAFPMPMTRTRSFPHPFATPNHPKGRLYNDMTYVLFDYAIWRAIAARTNTFRATELKIPATSYEKLEVWRIPYLYSFSPSIVPSPLDWLDWIHCTGYWFLDNPQTGWRPDSKLKAFVEAKDSRPLVYIGFGSIIVSDTKEITRIIIEAILLSNVRAIVSKGWSSRLQQDASVEEDDLAKHPDAIFSIHSVPHDWLFPKVRAVIHHGGAGTTAAGLRAGRPTIIKPFFADQFFWGERVEEMGIGRCIKQLTVEGLSAALRVVSTDEHMLKLAKKVGEKISSESGVDTAIHCIYRDMELAKARTLSSIQKTTRSDEDHIEEGWTLIDKSASGSIFPEA
ncbi:Sterol 3-beta-glucosyltransferase [Rhizopus stolonifer]|uniref:sterol 3beta-glucosyltransferase n=1 Tax=Rhizopus stolonifer TaxID=4846 RepID=A0A367KUZ4_RHIST|nr:Sterol 3-beta-glucosyltransferase [Rhizopus stolonifer]